MKKLFLVLTSFFFASVGFSQSVSQKLQKAWQQFESDSQLKHAISSLYVIDAKTGQVIFDKNSQIGLAPASTQKIITAATAFELLGKDYRYKTEFGYAGRINDSLLIGKIYLKSNGDPTFGSWRFPNTISETINKNFIDGLRKNKIFKFRGSISGVIGNYGENTIPDGWIWQDIGNYYGASPGAINWNENQFELVLKPGQKQGDSVVLVQTNPTLNRNFISELTSGAKNSGDNAYIYFSPSSSSYLVKGTVPCCVDKFAISGALNNGTLFTLGNFSDVLEKSKYYEDRYSSHINVLRTYIDDSPTSLYTHYSPSLDSISYWFLKKSINLYGEALLKTFAYEKDGFGSTEGGVKIVKDFWKQRGIDEDELNISDGSGLSPQNRVTTHAQVEILKYAKTKDWFPYFYDGLPDYNDMKMKSGTIRDVKGFCGYHKAKDGKEYIFSFLVNNYNGRTSGVVNKMYKVLDELK